MWFKSCAIYKIGTLIDQLCLLNQLQATCLSLIGRKRFARIGRRGALDLTEIVWHRWSRTLSIGSNPSQMIRILRLQHVCQGLVALTVAARRRGSVDDAADEIGRAGKSEVAHQVRNEALILVAALVGQGEHGGDDNCSPELIWASVRSDVDGERS